MKQSVIEEFIKIAKRVDPTITSIDSVIVSTFDDSSIIYSLSELEKIKNILDWVKASQKPNVLSEDFIREFANEVCWHNISYSQKLSESFINEFQDKVDWQQICYHQKLSENFIREFKDKVSWYLVSKYQDLSENFIREFKDKVSWKIYHIVKNYLKILLESLKIK